MLRNLNFSIIVFYWHFHHFHTFQQFTLILKLYWFIIKLVHIFVLHPLVFLIVCNHLNLLGFFIKLFKIPLWAFLYAKTFSNKIFWVNVYMEHILVYILLLLIYLNHFFNSEKMLIYGLLYTSIFIQWTCLGMVIVILGNWSSWSTLSVYLLFVRFISTCLKFKSTNILGGMCNLVKLVILYWSHIDLFHHLHPLILI